MATKPTTRGPSTPTPPIGSDAPRFKWGRQSWSDQRGVRGLASVRPFITVVVIGDADLSNRPHNAHQYCGPETDQ
jgi:hypothetical protein